MAELESAGRRGSNSGPQQTATAAVAESLAQIVLTEMAPGSSIPSEGDLALRFAVSRLTIREAIKMLAGRGLLEVSRGRRAVVREPSGIALSDYIASHVQGDPKGLFDVLELRLSLEVQSASLAARRLNRAGLAAMEAAMTGMRDAANEGRAGYDPRENETRFHDHDLGFHGAIALASGNRLISHLFEAMAVPLRRGFNLSLRGHILRGRGVEETIAAHQAILVAIREGNPKAAEAAMRNHIEETERDIRAAFDQAPSQPGMWASRPGAG